MNAGEAQTEAVTLSVVRERLAEGLAHSPHISAWDPDIAIWSCDPTSDFGAVDGWLWATDRVTALIERAEGCVDISFRAPLGRKVVESCDVPVPAVAFRVLLTHLASTGGNGHVPELGDFDLDRVWEAALWVAGELDTEQEAVIVAPDRLSDQPILRIYPIDTARTRRAVVAGCTFGGWFARILLPLETFSTEPRVSDAV